MGGLRKKIPVVFWTFLIGSASLAALPLVTAGFYSKDQIIWFAWSAAASNPWLWAASITGAFLTSLYTFRLVFLVFFGETKTLPIRRPGRMMLIPLFVLAAFSILAGFIELPGSFGNVHLFSRFVESVLPAVSLTHANVPEAWFQVLSAVISLTGIYLAYLLYMKHPALGTSFHRSRLSEFFYTGWGFDRAYDVLIVRPLVWLAEVDKNDFIDIFNSLLARITVLTSRILGLSQNGKLRWYVMGFALGIVFILTILMNL